MNKVMNRNLKLKKELKRTLQIIKKVGAKKVILFGSLAKNDKNPGELDLIIIKETNKKFLDRLDEFYSEIIPNVATDVLVYTPKEFKEIKKREFFKNTLKEGVVLYEGK